MLGLCAFVVLVGLWNARAYPPGLGYDAAEHMAYADGLVPGLHIPRSTGEFYTPPLFYLVAGSADWLAGRAGIGDPHRATALVDIVLLLGTMLLVRQLAGILWPERRWSGVIAAAFLALLPVSVKAMAMFHPELLDLFLSTLGVYLGVRLLNGRASVPLAAAAGAALGLAQLVRAFALWSLLAVALGVALSRRWRELAVLVAVAALIPAPWYARQWVVYGTPLPFNRSAPDKPLYDRRPLGFYVGSGLPDVVTHPTRGHFVNQAIPVTYSELWGDYFGHWAWNGSAPGTLTRSVRRSLSIQALLGALPTLLAVAGTAAFAWRSLRHRSWLPAGLLAPLGLLGFLSFTVAYPSADGDVIKATYMLTTAPGWALGFAYVLGNAPRRAQIALGAALALCVVVELPFLFYGS